jgi:hypothetical protein
MQIIRDSSINITFGGQKCHLCNNQLLRTIRPRTGVGAWSEEDFRRAMHEGMGRGGVRLYPTMPYPAYTKVTRDDASAIWAYLRTLAGAQRGSAKPTEVPVQRSPASHIRLGFDQFQARRVSARSGEVRCVETRRLSGRRSWSLWNLSYVEEHHRRRPRQRSPARGVAAGLVRADLTEDPRTGIGSWSIEEIVR